MTVLNEKERSNALLGAIALTTVSLMIGILIGFSNKSLPHHAENLLLQQVSHYDSLDGVQQARAAEVASLYLKLDSLGPAPTKESAQMLVRKIKAAQDKVKDDASSGGRLTYNALEGLKAKAESFSVADLGAQADKMAALQSQLNLTLEKNKKNAYEWENYYAKLKSTQNTGFDPPLPYPHFEF